LAPCWRRVVLRDLLDGGAIGQLEPRTLGWVCATLHTTSRRLAREELRQ